MKYFSQHAEKIRYHVGVVVTDLTAFMGVTSFEIGRFYTINEAGREFFSELTQSPIPPPNYDSPLVQVLQYSGDFWDGYLISLAIYYLLSAVSIGKIPEKIRLGAAFFTSYTIVLRSEVGISLTFGTSDLSDLPAGIVGAVAFVGIHYLAKRVGARALDKNKTEELCEIEQIALDNF